MRQVFEDHAILAWATSAGDIASVDKGLEAHPRASTLLEHEAVQVERWVNLPASADRQGLLLGD